VKPYLLDTNVLIALAWPNHVHHGEAMEWFVHKGSAGFRTCPLTQTGFVRISSNPAFTRDAVTPGEALALLGRITKLPGHDFWPDDVALAAAVGARPVVGHRQVVDAYLLGLAAEHGGAVATLDRGLAALAAGGSRGSVEMVLGR
jgi:toxin-antitoxin system PIN domain toxin